MAKRVTFHISDLKLFQSVKSLYKLCGSLNFVVKVEVMFPAICFKAHCRSTSKKTNINHQSARNICSFLLHERQQLFITSRETSSLFLLMLQSVALFAAACKHNIQLGPLLPGGTPPEVSERVRTLLVPTQQATQEYDICFNEKNRYRLGSVRAKIGALGPPPTCFHLVKIDTNDPPVSVHTL